MFDDNKLLIYQMIGQKVQRPIRYNTNSCEAKSLKLVQVLQLVIDGQIMMASCYTLVNANQIAS